MDFNNTYYSAVNDYKEDRTDQYIQVLFDTVRKLQDQVFELKNELNTLRNRLTE